MKIARFLIIFFWACQFHVTWAKDQADSKAEKKIEASSAEDDVKKGLEVALEVDRRDTGFGDSVADLRMILTNRNNDESIRKLKLKTLEMKGDGDKSLSVFSSPRDVKGTAFLSFTHAVKADEQWLYLPALKRVKRISSDNKSGPFLGSEFAYEDLTSFEIEKYSYRYLRDEKTNGIDCFVLLLKPLYKHSGYVQEMSWIDKARYIPIKIDYYDRKKELLKTLTYTGYQQYLNQYWRAREMLMVNHVTGKKTLLTWENYKFRNDFTERNFDQNTLKRAR
ncbi:MAG: outer membrane lipoprotein-sorting protein [Methylococcaceae bacterium]